MSTRHHLGTAAGPAAELERRTRELAELGHVAALLSWDQETHMPPAAADGRAGVLATVRVLAHGRLVDEELGRLLEEVPVDGDERRAALVRELKRRHDRAVCQPPELVRRLALAESRGLAAWRVARERRDFALFQTHLAEIVALKREQADCLGHEGERYDALLDEYEPGMRTARLEPLLGALREELVRLLDAIDAAGPPPTPAFVGRRFPEQGQWDFTMRILADLGFDLEAGRQDRSAHPFTTALGPGDVRLTTRIDELDPFSAIFATIHEAGHGLYDQGFGAELEDTPLADAPSYGMHESQSRLWENPIGRSLAFWQHYTPLMRRAFPEALPVASPLDVFRHVNRVERSLIRVEADEVTYNLHIAVRFGLELALMRGELEAPELPEAWNAAYESHLGIRPSHDGEGVLQDIHWAQGSIGYFPSYTLGNLYAALLWERLGDEFPDMADRLGRAEFGHVLTWLREHVHRHGRIYGTDALVERVTGRTLRHEPFMRYLWEKYGALYGVRP